MQHGNQSKAFFDHTFGPVVQAFENLQDTTVAVYGGGEEFQYLDFILETSETPIPPIAAFFDHHYKKLQGSPLTNVAPIFTPGAMSYVDYGALVVLPRANQRLIDLISSFKQRKCPILYIEPQLVDDLKLAVTHYLILRKAEQVLQAESHRTELNYHYRFAAANHRTASLDNMMCWNIRGLTHAREPGQAGQPSGTCPANYVTYVKEILTKVSNPKSKIMEYGCGFGGVLAGMCPELADRSFWGLDISRVQIQEARGMVGDRVTLDVVRDNRIPFEDHFFDITYTTGVLDHISYPEVLSVAEEIARVTKEYLLLVEPANNVVPGYNSDNFGDHYHFDHNYQVLFESLGFKLAEAWPIHMGSNLVLMLFKREG